MAPLRHPTRIEPTILITKQARCSSKSSRDGYIKDNPAKRFKVSKSLRIWTPFFINYLHTLICIILSHTSPTSLFEPRLSIPITNYTKNLSLSLLPVSRRKVRKRCFRNVITETEFRDDSAWQHLCICAQPVFWIQCFSIKHQINVILILGC